MNVLPRTNRDLLSWMQSRIDAWQDEAAAIGLTKPELDGLELELAEAREAYEDARSTRQAARAATVRWQQAGERMRGTIASLVATIKATAERTDDADIYVKGLIPRPGRRRRSLGPPPMPLMRSISMSSPGTMDIAWACPKRGGTLFLVYRAIETREAGYGPISLIDTTSRTTYRDRSLPRGVCGVAYQIVAQRSGGRSDPSSLAMFGFSGQDAVHADTGKGGRSRPAETVRAA